MSRQHGSARHEQAMQAGRLQRGLGRNAHHAAGLRVRYLRENTGNKRKEILEGVARCDKNQHEEARARKVLLKLYVLILQ